MSKRLEIVYLQDILDAAVNISNFAKGKSFVDFESDIMLHSAIIRQLEIIGEATKNLSNILRTKYSSVQWKKMAGLRDVLIHAYHEADYSRLWKVVEKDIPKLISEVELIISEMK